MLLLMNTEYLVDQVSQNRRVSWGKRDDKGKLDSKRPGSCYLEKKVQQVVKGEGPKSGWKDEKERGKADVRRKDGKGCLSLRPLCAQACSSASAFPPTDG